MDTRGNDMATSFEPRVGDRLPWGDRRDDQVNGVGTAPVDDLDEAEDLVDVTTPAEEVAPPAPEAAPVAPSAGSPAPSASQPPASALVDEVQRLFGEQEQRLAAAVEGRVADLLGDHEQRMGARLATVERRSQEAAATVDRAVSRLGAGLEALESVRSDLATRAADLGAQLETLRATISRQLPEVAARQRAILTAMETVQASLRETVTGLDDALDHGLGALATWRDELPAATRRVGAELGRDVDRARERLVEEAGHSTRQLEQAARRTEGLAESLARVEGLFEDRMARWERAGRHERRLVIEEVVGLLAGQLPARHRRRIAEDLLARSRETETEDGEPPVRPSGEAVSSELLPRSASTTLQPGPTDDIRPAPGSAAAPASVPTPAARAAAPPPVERESATDLDEVLEAIPGVGPARRQLLAETFGGLVALRAATVDQLADLPGITDELAERIHDHLRD